MAGRYLNRRGGVPSVAAQVIVTVLALLPEMTGIVQFMRYPENTISHGRMGNYPVYALTIALCVVGFYVPG